MTGRRSSRKFHAAQSTREDRSSFNERYHESKAIERMWNVGTAVSKVDGGCGGRRNLIEHPGKFRVSLGQQRSSGIRGNCKADKISIDRAVVVKMNLPLRFFFIPSQ